MYEKFSDSLRQVFRAANQEAQRFNHEYIGTEHLLLGLSSFTNPALTADQRVQCREAISRLVQKGPEMVTMGKLPQTPRAKRVVDRAVAIGDASGVGYIGVEHLLKALAEELEGCAGQVLKELGICQPQPAVAPVASCPSCDEISVSPILSMGIDLGREMPMDNFCWPEVIQYGINNKTRYFRLVPEADEAAMLASLKMDRSDE